MSEGSPTAAMAVKELDPWITTEEAARLLRVSKVRVYELLADGSIKSVKTGARRLIDTKSVLGYVESCSRKKQQRDPRVAAMVAARQANRAAKAAAHQQRPKLTRR